jgi:hypothetical protein
MISIICVYNDRELLEEYLLKSLHSQSADYELILLDNREGKYKSAPEALNSGGQKAQGDYLIFVHQDIDLKSDTWLVDAEKILNNLDNWGVAGVAGVPLDGILKSNIENGIPPIKPGQHIKNPLPVQTLDECLIIVPRTVFNKCKFDEELVGWHLYSVDYCLNIKRYGYESFVLPLYLYHRSYMVRYARDYYKLLKILFKKYKAEYTEINTSCGVWHTSYPLFWYKFLNTGIGLRLRRLLDRIK